MGARGAPVCSNKVYIATAAHHTSITRVKQSTARGLLHSTRIARTSAKAINNATADGWVDADRSIGLDLSPGGSVTMRAMRADNKSFSHKYDAVYTLCDVYRVFARNSEFSNVC